MKHNQDFKLRLLYKLLGVSSDAECKNLNTQGATVAYKLHIKDVLNEFEVTPKRAIEYITEVNTSVSPKTKTTLVADIIEYLRVLIETKANINDTKKKKADPLSLRQIAILCFITGEELSNSSYKKLLIKYKSSSTTNKILQVGKINAEILTNIAQYQNKKARTDNLTDLKLVKEYLTRKKITKVKNDINSIITTFEAAVKMAL